MDLSGRRLRPIWTTAGGPRPSVAVAFGAVASRYRARGRAAPTRGCPQTITHDHVHNLTDHELHRQLIEAVADLRAIGCGHVFDEPAGDDEKKPPKGALLTARRRNLCGDQRATSKKHQLTQMVSLAGWRRGPPPHQE
jgi:hypothetical protein